MSNTLKASRVDHMITC